ALTRVGNPRARRLWGGVRGPLAFHRGCDHRPDLAHQPLRRRSRAAGLAPLVGANELSGTTGRPIWAARPIARVGGRPYRGLHVADPDPPLDRRALRARGEPPEVDLVGVLELPPLLGEAQGLCLRRDCSLEDVHLVWVSSAPID